MNRQELVEQIAARLDSSKAAADNALSAVIDAIQEAVAKGEEVALVGFGKFGVRERDARAGRNPQTGKAIQIAASRTPVFSAGAKFKAAVAKD